MKPLLRRHPFQKVGITMLLKSILEEHSMNLFFKNEARHKGFIEQLSKVIE